MTCYLAHAGQKHEHIAVCIWSATIDCCCHVLLNVSSRWWIWRDYEKRDSRVEILHIPTYTYAAFAIYLQASENLSVLWNGKQDFWRKHPNCIISNWRSNATLQYFCTHWKTESAVSTALLSGSPCYVVGVFYRVLAKGSSWNIYEIIVTIARPNFIVFIIVSRDNIDALLPYNRPLYLKTSKTSILSLPVGYVTSCRMRHRNSPSCKVNRWIEVELKFILAIALMRIVSSSLT